MEFLKDLFNEDALTYDNFMAKADEKGYKIVDLKDGKYVSKVRHDKLSSERDRIKEKYMELKAKYADLINSIDGENGLKQNFEQVKSELNAKDALIKEIINNEEFIDAVLQKAGGKLILLESDKLTLITDLVAAKKDVRNKKPTCIFVPMDMNEMGIRKKAANRNKRRP